jgi:hypothetical protein
MSRPRFDAFWAWWTDAGPRIAAAIDNRTVAGLVADISSHVKQLDSGLAWEVGAGRRSRHNLTLSPDGNIVLRRLTERWLGSAPPADETWEYYPARQPAPILGLEIAGEKLDPTEWQFAVEVDEDRLLVNLTAHHPVLRRLPDRERPRAGFVALDQLFGEDAVEKWLGALDFTTSKPRGASSFNGVLRTIDRLSEDAKKEVFTLATGADESGHRLFLSFNQRLKRLDHLFAETRIQLDLRLRQPNQDGLTTDAEAEALNQLEDQLLAATAGAVYVGRLTGNGRRTMHFYAEDAPAALNGIATCLAANPGWEHGLRSDPDPEWAFYREGIYRAFARRASN